MSLNVRSLIAHLACRDAASAIDFYVRALNARPITVLTDPDGKLMYAALAVGDALFYLGESSPERGCPSPLELGGSGVTLTLAVGDCDAVFAQAQQAGCTPQLAPQDMFWGDRYAIVDDPYGHRWAFAQRLYDVPPDELQRAAEEFGCTRSKP